MQIQVGYLPANWDVLWSLSIEEFFYFGFPIICLLIKKEWHFIALISIFIVISPWARVGMYPENELGDRNYLAYIDSIAFGSSIALLVERINITKWIKNSALVLGSLLVFFILFFRKWTYQLGMTENGLYISVISFGMGLLLLSFHGKTQKLPFYFQWLVSIGTYSYEIYLTHMFVIIGFMTLYTSFTPKNNVSIYLLYSLSILFSYSLGKLIGDTFSNPMNRWIRTKKL